MRDNPAPDWQAFNQETREAWNENAAFWDGKMGEGNSFQRNLIGPTSERLLELKPDEWVLEIACGNGVFTRRMAQLGARVVASDFAEKMVERARARSSEYADRIEYRVLDATNEAQLLALGRQRFDAAVCNMALMDMATIEPLFSAASQLLKPDGRFVFSLTHPCFNTTGCKKVVEEEDREGEIVVTHAMHVSRYRNLRPAKGLAIVGQPKKQYYFDRTLSELFNTCFRAGFLMDALEEPAFSDAVSSNTPLDWGNFKEIPPVLVARLRLNAQVRNLP